MQNLFPIVKPPDTSFYDIRKYFRDEKNGQMNSGSGNETYTALIGDLRAKQKFLAKKSEIKNRKH